MAINHTSTGTEPPVRQQLWWKDRKIEDLTRDELIAACYHLHDRLEEHRQWARDDAEMQREFAATEKALKAAKPWKVWRDGVDG